MTENTANTPKTISTSLSDGTIVDIERGDDEAIRVLGPRVYLDGVQIGRVRKGKDGSARGLWKDEHPRSHGYYMWKTRRAALESLVRTQRCFDRQAAASAAAPSEHDLNEAWGL